MFHCGRIKNGGANIVLTNEGRWVDGRFEDRGLDTESHWCGVGGFLQMTSNLADSHKISLMGGNWIWSSLLNLKISHLSQVCLGLIINNRSKHRIV